MGIGLTSEAAPSTLMMLKTLLPTRLPMLISISFLRAATTEVASSGREVPKATIVNPINFSLTPSICIIFTADSTTIWAPPTTPIIPTKMSTICLDLEVTYSISSTPAATATASAPDPCFDSLMAM